MHKQKNLPVSLVLEHKASLKGLARVALRTFKISPAQHNYADWRDIPTIQYTIAAPQTRLIEHYLRWCNAPAERYQHVLPPHMVCQWGLASATELLLHTPYNIAKVINQGVALSIYGDLPRQQDLIISSKIQSVHENDGVVRVCVQVTTGTAEQPVLVETILHVAFLLADFKKSKPKKERVKHAWQSVGTWQASAHDGLRFALLTGDFNPIHWVGWVAKMSPFKQKVLHGFGMLVRSFEQLQQPIQHIDVRFLSPVPLPSPALQVQVLNAGEHKASRFRLVSGEDKVHLFGSYIPQNKDAQSEHQTQVSQVSADSANADSAKDNQANDGQKQDAV